MKKPKISGSGSESESKIESKQWLSLIISDSIPIATPIPISTPMPSLLGAQFLTLHTARNGRRWIEKRRWIGARLGLSLHAGGFC
jgi:hypothetical protein